MNYSVSTNDLEEYKTYLAGPQLATIIRDLEEWLDEEIQADDNQRYQGLVATKRELSRIKTEHLANVFR